MVAQKLSEKFQGDGLFADQDYPIGEVVLDWSTGGKVVHEKEFYEDWLYYDNAIQISEKEWIFHPITRYINHSCEPNCRVEDKNFVAIKPIRKGDEVIMDYSATENSKWIGRFECLCGNQNCRKLIKSFWMLNEEDKLRLKNILSEWMKESIVIHTS